MRKKYLLILVISLIVVLGLSQSVLAQSSEDTEKLEKVTGEIRLLNLINGLELDEAQMKFIVQKAEEAEQLKVDFLAKLNDDNPEMAYTLQTFQELRNNLLRDENVSDDLKAQVYLAESRRREIAQQYYDGVSLLALEIKAILEPHQLYTLEHYVPCLIAPKPWAAGQADSSEAGVGKLTELMEIPDSIFEENKERIAELVLERMRIYLPRGYVLDEEAEKAWIIALLEEARSLSDVDFAIESAELIEKLKSRYKLPALPIDISIKIERFLLTYEIIPLLKSKLAAGIGF